MRATSEVNGSRDVLRVEETEGTAETADTFASDVAYYLSLKPRQLPSHYLYDALGSVLFEAICELPWYGVTRAELGLLETHAREILAGAAPLARVVELGPGNGTKLRTMLAGRVGPGPARTGHYEEGVYEERVEQRGGGARGGERGESRRGAGSITAPLELHLIDVSATALDRAASALSSLAAAAVVRHQRTYEGGLREVAGAPAAAGRTLVLFLGSNIGNFDRPGAEAFLRTIRASLNADDTLLLGVDLVKPEADLLLAYDDPLGVTAAFDRNLLLRINRELGADFRLEAFAHRAVWNPGESRVEMHLVSLGRQRVRIPRARVDLTFDEGDTIWTESSYKYEPGQIGVLLAGAGFAPVERWTAARERFALLLVRAV